MRILGIDPGEKRVGVAISSGALVLARPAVALSQAIQSISQTVADEQVTAVVVGLPLQLDGQLGPAAQKALALARELSAQIAVPVLMLDERLTTKSAAGKLRDAGHSSRSSKALIDSQAACELLEHALERVVRGANLGQSLDEL